MNRISFSLLTAALAMFTLLILEPIFSSSAYASKMNGKGSGCSDRSCRGINSPNFGKKKSGKKTTSSIDLRIDRSRNGSLAA